MLDLVSECIWYLFFQKDCMKDIYFHNCVNNSDIKVLMKVIKTETFNVGFTSK